MQIKRACSTGGKRCGTGTAMVEYMGERNSLLFRIALGAAVFLFILPLLLVFAFHLPAVQERFVDHVVSRVQDSTGLEFKVGFCSWRPFTGIHLSGLLVRSGGHDILRCENVRVTLGISGAPPYVQAKEIYLEEPVLSLERDASGHWGLPGSGLSLDSPGFEYTPSHRPDESNLRLRIRSGTIHASRNGIPLLSIRDVTGAISLRVLPGSEKPSLNAIIRFERG